MFYNCHSLGQMTIPGSVTSIGESAFAGCSALTSCNIPGTVNNIGAYAFSSCLSLKNLFIPGSVHSIGVGAFENCKSLISINIPSAVTRIPEFAFAECAALPSIGLPANLTEIGFSAFINCKSLQSIHIPASVSLIGAQAFQGCTSMTSIRVETNNLDFSTPDGVLFNSDRTALLVFPAGRVGSYTIPIEVKELGKGAFAFTSLSELVVEWAKPIEISSSDLIFQGVPLNACTLVVPKGRKVAYQNADVWGTFPIEVYTRVGITGEE
jgi:hypothetical protein